MKQLLRLCSMLLLAGPMTAAVAQRIPCSEVLETEREFVRRFGGCRDIAPIVDVPPKAVPTAPAIATPVVTLVPNIVGLSFDEARARLPGFTVQRSYVASAEPGGTILQQQPAPPARLATGSTIRVVLSDGTLRPAPRVAATEIDAVRKPAETPVLPPAAQPPVFQQPAASVQPPQPASASVAQSSVEAPKLPAPTAAPPSSAQARKLQAPTPAPKAAVSQRGNVAPSKAPANRARVEPVPAPTAAAPVRPAPIETFELPNVIGRSSADATKALAEFKIERVEIVANAAPSGQVLAQDPKPGTAVAAGSAIGLQVSDGSLASPSVTAPVAAAAPAAPASRSTPAAPVPTRAPVTFPSTPVLLLIAGVLAGLGFGALLMRRWLAKRHDAADDLDAAPIDPAPAVDEGAAAAAASAPAIGDSATTATASAPARAIAIATAALAAPAVAQVTFVARLKEEGETTVEFAAPSDAEEMALEHSRNLDD